MKTIDLKTILAGAALGLLAVLGTSSDARAQGNSDHHKQAAKQQEKEQKQLAKAERERQDEWNKRNARFGTTRPVATGYYTIEPTMTVTQGRYRVNRNGTWYNTDNRGADLCRPSRK